MDSVAPRSGLSSSTDLSPEELQLATRNHGMPLEALRDPVTPAGLHYVLIHYDVPFVDPAAWRLELEGRVERPVSLSLDELRARPRVTHAVTMECAGNGRAQLEPRPISQPWLVEAVGNAEWTGTPLRGLLEEAGIGRDAVDVVFTGLDRGVEGGLEQVYQRALPLEEAMREDVLLAYEMGGAPLPPQHGFPLRLLVPGWYGMTSVKWLGRITVLAEPFEGYQHTRAYRLMQSDDDPGTPVTRILPRSLMAPPGIPDFLTRRRFVQLGPCRLEGRAWSGFGSIERVEVSADGGANWRAAELGEQPSPQAWRGWSYVWDPPGPGDYELASRATDSTGNAQPLEAPWNLKGYANNSVQRVPVTVGG
jgi:sulfane dehydrogenase subunit SoxC